MSIRRSRPFPDGHHQLGLGQSDRTCEHPAGRLERSLRIVGLEDVREDQLGRPAINFGMDARGATLLGELTGPHVNDKMAILLDDQVYTAPNLNSRITSSGQIMGDFSAEELRYIIRLLAAGSLSARLSEDPISVNTLGPELGKDRLVDGFRASIWALGSSDTRTRDSGVGEPTA